MTANFKSETCACKDLASYQFKKVTADLEKADGLINETVDECWPSEENWNSTIRRHR